jgi:hypothetical protein
MLCQAGFAEFKAGVHSTSTSYAAQIGMETLAKAGVTSILFYGAGQAVETPAGMEYDGESKMFNNGTYTNGQIAAKVALHMGAGCVSAAMNEGSCGRGAASAGTSALFTGMTTGHISSPLAQGALTVTIGGGASVIGGGKFSDGATVALAGYLWNELMHRDYGDSAENRLKRSGYLPTKYPDGSYSANGIFVDPNGNPMSPGEGKANLVKALDLAGKAADTAVVIGAASGNAPLVIAAGGTGLLVDGAKFLVTWDWKQLLIDFAVPEAMKFPLRNVAMPGTIFVKEVGAILQKNAASGLLEDSRK